MKQCKKLDFQPTPDVEVKLRQVVAIAYSHRSKTFGNGRFVRNLFEKTIELQANRIADLADIRRDALTTLTPEDIPDEMPG